MTNVEEEGASSGVGLLAAYSYDSLNRRTYASLGGGELAQSFTYDAKGDLTSDGNNSYGYNEFDRPVTTPGASRD